MPVSKLNQSLGAITDHRIEAHRLILDTATETIYLSFYHSDIVRVRITKKGAEERDFSYAVIAGPAEVKFQLSETDSELIISTDTTKIKIHKNPCRISFLTLDDQVVNQDDRGFGTSWLGTDVTTYKALQAGERFIGLGEKTGNLDRAGTAYVNWNTDKFAYADDHDPLYMTIPFYIGIHSGLQYGIFLDNTYKTKFNFGASNNRFSSFGAEGGEMNYYFINGRNVAQIIKHYSHLTGRMELPPMWSLGTQQCRYSYYPASEVMSVAQTYRAKKIPADVIYLDIHYMDAYKVFTFHPERFPEPKAMVTELREMGFHTTVILDPGIKVQETGYAPYTEAMVQDLFIKYPDGEAYTAEVWPSWSHFPDFTLPAARDWWAGQVAYYTQLGIDALWNDMNEPATWGQCVPLLIECDYDGDPTSHQQAHNVYGMQMARSSYEGARKHLAGQRPFILNRAGYSGVQRYTASWTGDNRATSDNMLCGVRLVTSLGLSGVAFVGYDVGGFAGEASADLFAKWTVLGCFSPLFRFHSMINSKDAEPWAFGEEAEEIARHYISLRYRLMPYIYSAFYESAQSGMPVARSLAIDYAHDATIYQPRYQNQYLFGAAILVPPVAEGAEFVKVYLPALPSGTGWYDLHSDTYFPAGEHIVEVRKERFPLFIKGGSIISMQSLVQSMSERPADILELHIYEGNSETTFDYYEDDASTYAYQSGAYFKRSITYSPQHKTLRLSAVEGSYESQFRRLRVYFHGFKKLTVPTEMIDYQYVPPVSSFDPFYAVEVTDMSCKAVQSLEIEHERGEIVVKI